VFDTIIQLAVQNPEITAILIVGIGVLWSWNRSPIPVPLIRGLHLMGLVWLIASGFYFIVVANPEGWIERSFRFVGDSVASLIIMAYGFKLYFDL